MVCTCPTFSGWSQARNNQANFFVKDLLAVDLCQPVLECIKGVVTAWVQFTSVSFAQIVEAWPGIEELQAMGDYEDMRLAGSDSYPAAWFHVSAAVSLRKLHQWYICGTVGCAHQLSNCGLTAGAHCH